MVTDEYLEELMDSGERVPPEMWEPGLSETPMAAPVFDGVSVVDKGED